MSALRTGSPYPSGNIRGTHFCYRLSRPQGHSAARRIISVKNLSDTIENQTRHLLVCSAVPQLLYPIHLHLLLCKGKGIPVTDHASTQGKLRYSSTLSLTSALDSVNYQRHVPAALPSRNSSDTHSTEGWMDSRTCLDG